jgi:hypothetical protein
MIPPQTRTLDDSKYQWKQSQDDPALWQREALAVENLWPLKPKEVRELFLGVELLLFELIDAARISSATQEAWKELRIRHPDIALTARVQSGGKRLLEFHVPQSNHDIQKLVERTLMTRAGSQKILIFDLQTTQRKSDIADSALLSLQ